MSCDPGKAWLNQMSFCRTSRFHKDGLPGKAKRKVEAVVVKGDGGGSDRGGLQERGLRVPSQQAPVSPAVPVVSGNHHSGLSETAIG